MQLMHYMAPPIYAGIQGLKQGIAVSLLHPLQTSARSILTVSVHKVRASLCSLPAPLTSSKKLHK